MRRVGVFITAGPAFGLTVMMLMSLYVESRFPGVHDSAMFILFAFIASLSSSVIAGIVDIGFREKSWRIWATTVAGAAVGLSGMLYVHGPATGWQAVSFCISGALPAAVCSWLAGEPSKR